MGRAKREGAPVEFSIDADEGEGALSADQKAAIIEHNGKVLGKEPVMALDHFLQKKGMGTRGEAMLLRKKHAAERKTLKEWEAALAELLGARAR